MGETLHQGGDATRPSPHAALLDPTIQGVHGGHYRSLGGTPQLTLLINYQLFEELTGLPMSPHTAYEVTHAVPKGLTVLDVAPIREAIVGKIAAIAADQTRPHGLHRRNARESSALRSAALRAGGQLNLADIPALVNLQNVHGKAKPYQVKQLLRLIERYKLQMEEEP